MGSESNEGRRLNSCHQAVEAQTFNEPAITNFLLFGYERGRTALPNDKHRAQLLKFDFSRRISDFVSDEIVDKFPPLFELLRLLFGYRFDCRACGR